MDTFPSTTDMTTQAYFLESVNHSHTPVNVCVGMYASLVKVQQRESEHRVRVEHAPTYAAR